MTGVLVAISEAASCALRPGIISADLSRVNSWFIGDVPYSREKSSITNGIGVGVCRILEI